MKSFAVCAGLIHDTDRLAKELKVSSYQVEFVHQPHPGKSPDGPMSSRRLSGSTVEPDEYFPKGW